PVPPDPREAAVIGRSVNREAARHLAGGKSLLRMADHRVRLSRTTPGQVMSRGPASDIALLEQRGEDGAPVRTGGRDHRGRQTHRGELVEPLLIAFRV